MFDIDGYTIDDNVTLAGERISILMGATLVLLGLDVLSDDDIGGAGRVSERGTAAIDDNSGGLTLSGAALFVDMATVNQNACDLTLGPMLTDVVTARNIKGATWTLNAGADIFGNGASEFVNLGLLDQNGSSTISANFYDRGGAIQADGVLTFQSGSDVNRFINDTIDGSGTLVVDGGVFVGSDVSTETVDLTGTRIVGDVTISSSAIVIVGLNLGAGSVLSLTNADATITLEAQQISGPGEIDIKGDDTVIGGGGATFLVGGATFANTGNTTFTGNNQAFALLTTPGAGQQVTIENEAGATWTETIAGAAFEQDGGAGTSLFLNDGKFVEDAQAAGLVVYIPVDNNGAFEAGSQVQFINAVTGTGTVDIGAEVSVRSVGGGETFNFDAQLASTSGSAPILDIVDPSLFAGTVTGFGATGDQIDVNLATGWQYEGFQPNGGGNGGALMFSHGDLAASISLAGSYDPNSFHAVASGLNTAITYG